MVRGWRIGAALGISALSLAACADGDIDATPRATAPVSTTSATTTTEPPSPDARAAVEQANELTAAAPVITYTSISTTDAGPGGRFTVFNDGVRTNDPPAWSFAFRFQADPRLARALGIDTTGTDSLEFRFVDERVWLGTAAGWIGAELDEAPDLRNAEVSADAGTFVALLLEDPDAGWHGPTAAFNNRSRYTAHLEADKLVPSFVVAESLRRLTNAGWDATTGLTIEVAVTLDPEGRVERIEMDQTEWWQAGWEAIGLPSSVGTVTYSMSITYPAEPIVLEPPCDDPAPGDDPAFPSGVTCP